METGPSNQPGKQVPPHVRDALDRLYARHPEVLAKRLEKDDLAYGSRSKVLRPQTLHVPVKPPVTPPTEVEQSELIPDEDGHWVKK